MGKLEAGLPPPSTEKDLLQLWRLQTVNTRFVTQTGVPLRVIYPGRLNGGPGPDILDAVIQRQDTILTGDIELHLRSSSWWAHGHHLDPNYNGVVLHVVQELDQDRPVRLASGLTAETLALMPGNEANRIPCRPLLCRAVNQPENVPGVLETLGAARFLVKARRLASLSRRIGAAQCLYQEIMAALGYSRNQLPFRELTSRVPVKALKCIMQDEEPAEARQAIQEVLMTAAGLYCGNSRSSSYPKWELAGVRPANHPARRIAAMSYLAPRLFGSSLQSRLKYILALSFNDIVSQIQVPAAGISQGICQPDLLGKGRAAEIVINVVLPFSVAYSQTHRITGLKNRALALYRDAPALPHNSIERHMVEQLILKGKVRLRAIHQQGLLYLYREFCVRGRCAACPAPPPFKDTG